MLQARVGQIIGRYHMQKQLNNQDAFAASQYNGHMIGVVCDGCGSGDHSEVGAKLAAQYMHGQIVQMLNSDVPLDEIPPRLYENTLQFLSYLITGVQPQNIPHYLSHHLLFTVIGVIVNKDGGVMFNAGDGLCVIDDQIDNIDMNNKPPYMAYHLLDPVLLGDYTMPTTFDVRKIPADWQKLAIATDGFETALLPDIWGFTNPRGLQRKLNYWSNEEHRFQDDTTLITVERLTDDDDTNGQAQ